MTLERPNDKRINIDETNEHLRKLSEMEIGFIHRDIEYLEQFMNNNLSVSGKAQDLLDTYDTISMYRSQNNTLNANKDILDEKQDSLSVCNKNNLSIKDKEIVTVKSSKNIPVLV